MSHENNKPISVFVLMENGQFRAIYSTEAAAMEVVERAEKTGRQGFEVEENFYHNDDECWKVWPKDWSKD